MTALQGIAALIVISVVAFAGMLFYAIEEIDKHDGGAHG